MQFIAIACVPFLSLCAYGTWPKKLTGWLCGAQPGKRMMMTLVKQVEVEVEAPRRRRWRRSRHIIAIKVNGSSFPR